jgi:hypothetical protein
LTSCHNLHFVSPNQPFRSPSSELPDGFGLK